MSYSPLYKRRRKIGLQLFKLGRLLPFTNDSCGSEAAIRERQLMAICNYSMCLRNQERVS